MEKGETSGGERRKTKEEGSPEMFSDEEEEWWSKVGSTEEEGEEKGKGYEGAREMEEEKEEPVAGRGEEEKLEEISGKEERKEEHGDGGEAAGIPWKEESHEEDKEVSGEGSTRGEIGRDEGEDPLEEKTPKEETPERGSLVLEPRWMEVGSRAKGGHKGDEVITAQKSGDGANGRLGGEAEQPEPSPVRTTVLVIAGNGEPEGGESGTLGFGGNLPSKLSLMTSSRVRGDLAKKQHVEPTPKLILEAVGETTGIGELTGEAGGSRK